MLDQRFILSFIHNDHILVPIISHLDCILIKYTINPSMDLISLNKNYAQKES